MKIEAKIQKWGNGLALRVSGAMRDIPKFQEGAVVEVEVNEDGFVVKKQIAKLSFSFTEAELLEGLTPDLAHTDLIISLTNNEIDY